MTSDRTDQHPSSVLPAWLPLNEEARRRAWEAGRPREPFNAETLAALAVLVRPVAPQAVA